MEITPQFVTFEQAKQLKSLGFDVLTFYYYGLTNSYLSLGSDLPAQNWNGTIEDHMDEVELYSRPELWQVVEWFYHVHHIWIRIDSDFITFDAAILRPDDDAIYLISTLGDITKYTFTSSNEAYLGAIDYVLNNIIKK